MYEPPDNTEVTWTSDPIAGAPVGPRTTTRPGSCACSVGRCAVAVLLATRDV
jgi:hypothetical protein